jgi:hypothetical protein
LQEEQPKIVIIGSLQAPMQELSRQLKEAGFSKVTEKRLSEVELPARWRVGIVIFLPKTPKEPRNRVAQRLRKSIPSLKIVMLYDDAISGTEVADAVINSNCDIADLVRVLTYLSKNNPREKARGA